MLDKSLTPASTLNKLNHLTNHLTKEQTELFVKLLARSNQNSPKPELKMKRQPRHEGINTFPLTTNQEEFWLLNQQQPACMALNLSSAYVLNGHLNVDALEKTFNEIVKRHENLRTTFKESDGTPMQYISPAVPFSLPVIDLQSIADKEGQYLAIKEILKARTLEPYDFTRGPLFKIVLIQLSDTEHVVWWGMHHILADGLGLTILLKEINALYSWYAFNKEHDLPVLEVQCSDYAVWQREYVSANDLDQHLKYWKNHLSGYNPKLSLPTDYKRPPIQTYNGSEQLFYISSRIDSSLKSLSGETGISLFMLLLTAFHLLTYYFTKQLDMVIGSPISQRNRQELEHLICDLSNMLLYRTILSEHDRLYDAMEKVKKTCLEAYQNQAVPSQEIYSALNPDVSPAYSPLFQMMFVFHQIFPTEQEQFLEGLSTSYFNIEKKSSQFDISLFMFDDDQNGLYGKFEYNTDLYAKESILKFIHIFQVVLSIMIETPNLKLSELSSTISRKNQLNTI